MISQLRCVSFTSAVSGITPPRPGGGSWWTSRRTPRPCSTRFFRQLVTEIMSSLDDRAPHAVLDALAVANDALDAAPHDLPPPAARRAPAHLRRDG